MASLDYITAPNVTVYFSDGSSEVEITGGGIITGISPSTFSGFYIKNWGEPEFTTKTRIINFGKKDHTANVRADLPDIQIEGEIELDFEGWTF